ncbi:MAG: ATP-grasp domain-containing protein [Candidatus Thorarchaeota archaeon]|jgi:predicted ATP-grasp superfamily ATP-dependent carboligase
MKVFLYEHITGGGLAGEAWDPSFAAQALVMQHTMSNALTSTGHDVLLAHDKRIDNKLLPKKAKIYEVAIPEDWQQKIASACEEADIGIVIAPEDEGILSSVMRIIRSTGLQVIGPDSTSIKLCSDKANCVGLFNDLSVETPVTITGTKDRILNESESIEYPVVVKPSVSSGATHLTLVRNPKEMDTALKILDETTSTNQILVQEYLKGIDASVSLLVGIDWIEILSVNRQYVSLEGPSLKSSYLGGECPFQHSGAEKAIEASRRIVDALPGLQGYVGIDFILKDSNALAIEINPRLTVSAVGIARTRGHLALVSTLSCLDEKQPELHPFNGYSAFREFGAPSILELRSSLMTSIEVSNLDGVASPPIPLDQYTVRPYLCAWGTTAEESRENLLGITREVHRRFAEVSE